MAEGDDRQLQAQIVLLKRLRDAGRLSEEDYRTELAALGANADTEPDLLERSAPAEQTSEQPGSGATYHVHIGHAYGTGIGEGAQVTLPAAAACPPGTDDAEALACYLRHVVEANRRLTLQGIRSAGQLVSVELERVYVTLTATERRTADEEERMLAEMAGLAPGERHRLGLAGAAQVQVKVQEPLADHRRLAVLGDPGCGKTTLLRWLALTYARDVLGQERLVQERLGLDERRLPVLLPLRALAHHLDTVHPDSGLDGPALLLDYLHAYFANQDILLPERFFADRLQKGECVVLLDGVDEVAEVRTRQRVARLIERFTDAYPDNRYVVTSRIVGYTGAARLGADYALTTVRDFSDDDIAQFVAHWSLAVEIVLAGEDTPEVRRAADRQAETLLKAIRANERVRELAVNPLLLTVVALVQRYRAQLPERRAELYEEAVEVLLGKWDEAKGLETTALLRGVELDAGDRRSLLEPVALWMMERRAHELDAEDLRAQLVGRFRSMTADERQAVKAVGDFLTLIGERSGLLVERGLGVYAFSHLTFQEHLAARAVADRPDHVAYTLDRLGDSWWREVVLLQAGYLSTQGKRRTTELIRAIVDCTDEPELYHNLVLAAECLRDVGPARVEGDLGTEVMARLRQPFETPLKGDKGRSREALTEQVRRRAAAAEALAKIESGAPGTQPAFWRLPHGEPVWVEVPGGDFWMGGEAYGDEKPVHQVHLETFYIARVLVTNAQYRIFCEAAGHRAPGHWTDGRVPRGLEGHPMVNVTWHDALAYCRWLDEVLRETSYRIQAWCGGRVEARDLGAEGWRVCLPSEAEWEKAARGDRDRRAYPWGDEWDEAKCNTRELGLGGTTPAGIFPEGASPYGCLEMAGNVWEWTRSIEKQYPYDPSDGREELEGSDDAWRVLRGGSFDFVRDYARCAYRSWGLPRLDWGNLGFRCVVSPIS